MAGSTHKTFDPADVGIVQIGGASVRHRVILLTGAAAALGLLDAGLPMDLNAFAGGGRAIVTGHLAQVYAHPGTQAGPIQLVLSWLLMLGSSGSGPAWVVAVVFNASAMLVAIGVCRRYASGAERRAGATSGAASSTSHREVLVGALVLFWLVPGPLWDGHPVEVLVPTLWLVGVVGASSGRGVRAGLALGLAVAIAPWGVLGFPAVLACRRLRSAFTAGAVGVAVAALLYLPFELSGHFALFDYRWPIGAYSLVHLVAPHLHQMTWELRLVQAAAVTVGTGCAALLLRRRQASPTVAVLVAAVLRVGTDPVQLNYYWTSAGVTAIAIVATVPATRQAWWAAAAAYTAWAGATSGWTLWAVGISLALVVPIAAVRHEVSTASLGLRLRGPSRMISISPAPGVPGVEPPGTDPHGHSAQVWALRTNENQRWT